MKTPVKILVLVGLAVAVVATIALKQTKPAADTNNSPHAANASTATLTTASATAVANAKLPKLVDLGASKCIPCKMMKPILDDLNANYADRFITEFIDVWENPDAGKPYGIRAIPTQIFFDGEGKELFRHEGFYGKEDILRKWKEFGVSVSGSKPTAGILREALAAVRARPCESVCFMCDHTKTMQVQVTNTNHFAPLLAPNG